MFPEVDALLSDTPLLPGLDGRKMSKSYGNAINISMTAEETAKRIKKSQTDGERMITFDRERVPAYPACSPPPRSAPAARRPKSRRKSAWAALASSRSTSPRA